MSPIKIPTPPSLSCYLPSTKSLRQKETNRIRRLRNREHINRAKTRPCHECGIQYGPWVMQFNHREPMGKDFELGHLQKTYSLKRIQAEIDKCDVVCSNCHLEIFHAKKQWLLRGTMAGRTFKKDR